MQEVNFVGGESDEFTATLDGEVLRSFAGGKG